MQQGGIERGYVTDAQTMYDLSRDWYRGRMDVDWQPPTPERVEAVFAAHGLAGGFWRMA